MIKEDCVADVLVLDCDVSICVVKVCTAELDGALDCDSVITCDVLGDGEGDWEEGSEADA